MCGLSMRVRHSGNVLTQQQTSCAVVWRSWTFWEQNRRRRTSLPGGSRQRPPRSPTACHRASAKSAVPVGDPWQKSSAAVLGHPGAQLRKRTPTCGHVGKGPSHPLLLPPDSTTRAAAYALCHTLQIQRGACSCTSRTFLPDLEDADTVCGRLQGAKRAAPQMCGTWCFSLGMVDIPVRMQPEWI